ncbi:MAG TPA: hypothetical protein VFT53_00110 [Candidatus Saccharimonadales bacterium]|nr:hypothetical protein [Candidatus Saccharimonadales bacterium]
MPKLFANKHHAVDPVWHAQVAMIAAIALQVALPDHFSPGSRFIIPTIEILLVLALGLTTPKERIFRSLTRRVNAILLIAITSATNAYSLIMVASQLLKGTHAGTSGKELIIVALNIYLTNIIIFGLWYWEMDGGGPGERARIAKYEQDFLFPQHQNETYKHPEWKPTFVDYLYVSATNAMAFSPTDTMPLSRRAKILMLLQATVSLVAIALVAARAVNILG